MRTLIIAWIILACSVMPCSSTTIRVDWAGGGDYLTIQEGVDAASEGDTVLVASGTYSGPNNRVIDLGAINIVLMSEGGPENTIIDCENIDDGIRVDSGQDTTTVIRGFTITNADGGNGGGIAISQATAIIENCVLVNNNASNGAGIYYGYATVPGGAVRNCVFYGNSADWRGGGVAVNHCYSPNEPRITNCIFYDNVAGIVGSYGGGGIFVSYSEAFVTGCTLVENAGGPGAGGIGTDASNPTVTRTVVAFSTEGEGMHGVDAEHCIVFGNAGGDTIAWNPDNLYLDPLFCDITTDNFTLCENSPCLPANNTWSELVGAYNQGCGECDAPVEASAWSVLKSIFLD